MRWLAIPCLVAVAALAGCGGGGGTTHSLPGSDQLAREIKADLQKRVDATVEGTVTIHRVQCVENHDKAMCYADLSQVIDGEANDSQVKIDVTPGDDGSYIWESAAV